jgi:hypothetical protein
MAFELRNNTPHQNKMLRGNNIYYTKASMVTNDGRTAALLAMSRTNTILLQPITPTKNSNSQARCEVTLW